MTHTHAHTHTPTPHPAHTRTYKYMQELDTNWKLLWTLMLGSFGTLVVTYSTLVWMYTEKVAETPCVGICEITPKLVRASPPGI